MDDQRIRRVTRTMVASKVRSGYYRVKREFELKISAKRATWRTKVPKGDYYVNSRGELFSVAAGGYKEEFILYGVKHQVSFPNLGPESAKEFTRNSESIENPTQSWICEIFFDGNPDKREIETFIDFLDDTMMELSYDFGEFRANPGKLTQKNKIRVVPSGVSGSPRKFESAVQKEVENFLRRFSDRFPSIGNVRVEVKKLKNASFATMDDQRIARIAEKVSDRGRQAARSKVELVTYLPIDYNLRNVPDEYQDAPERVARHLKMRISEIDKVKVNKNRPWEIHSTVNTDPNNVGGAIYYFERGIIGELENLSARDEFMEEYLWRDWEDRKFHTEVM